MNRILIMLITLGMVFTGGFLGSGAVTDLEDIEQSPSLATPRPQPTPRQSPARSDVQWTIGSRGGIDSTEFQDLSNIHQKGYLEYGERSFGINLVWGNGVLGRSAFFENCTRLGDPIYGSDLVAIRVAWPGVRGKHYLAYGSRSSGINLVWSEDQACQFRLVSRQGSKFGPTGSEDGLFAIYNVKHNAYLVYGERSFGINLKWRKAPAPHTTEARVDFVPVSIFYMNQKTVYLTLKNQGNVASTSARFEMEVMIAGEEHTLTILRPVGPGETLRNVPISLDKPLSLCEKIKVAIDIDKVFQTKGMFGNDVVTMTIHGRGESDLCNDRLEHFQNERSPSIHYLGATYTAITQAVPDLRLGDLSTCIADGDDPPGSSHDMSTLMRWAVIRIPAGAKVKDASITLNITNPSNDEYHLYEIKRDWDWWGRGVTWKLSRSFSPWAQAGALGSQDRGTKPVGTLKASSTGPKVIRLNNAGIALVQMWIDNPSSNQGLILANSQATDGVDFHCSEASIAANRPMLQVDYSWQGQDKTIWFQNGQRPYKGYDDATDVVITQAVPDLPLGDLFNCLADGDDPPGTGHDMSTLLRWDLRTIPAGTRIRAASITLHTSDASFDEYYLYEMKRGWVDHEATWKAYREGAPWARAGASDPQDRGNKVLGRLKATSTGKFVIRLNNDGVALVQRWIDNPASNHGLIIANSQATDGVDFRCIGIVMFRPMLTIELIRPLEAVR
ncbi:MAG: DNRLRE domain-containing protein [Planctomycetota bacterium]|nr:MAG: DNRLRE domain-containing protein [Planctomycetota bacterium]